MSSYEITADHPGSWLNWTDAVSWTIAFDPNGELVAMPHILSADARASGVNNTDTVCGQAWAFEEPTEALIWTGNNSTVLDREKWVFSAQAYDIGDSGIVVGTGSYWKNFDQGPRAVVWPSSDGSMIILENFLGRNSPFAHLSSAYAVNQTGAIVGLGWDGASTKAYLAIPK